MKQTKIILIIGMLVIWWSCERETVTGNVSRVTYFVDLILKGEELIFLKLNENFTDPGAEANEKGAPVTVTKKGAVSTATAGFYRLSYSASNSDGFSSEVTRTVIVYEDKPVTGIYNGTRVGRTGGLILISSNPDGSFHISDLLGGYYEYGQGFGPDYAAPATLTLNGNEFTTPGGLCAFGPVDVSNAHVSDDQRTWEWTITLTDFAFGFNVKLTKITE